MCARIPLYDDTMIHRHWYSVNNIGILPYQFVNNPEKTC
jgi:hypothetical protein